MNSHEFGGIDPSFSPALTPEDTEILAGNTEALDRVPSVAVHLGNAIKTEGIELATRLADIAARQECNEISPEEADQERAVLHLIDVQRVRSHVRSAAAYFRERAMDPDYEEIEEPEED